MARLEGIERNAYFFPFVLSAQVFAACQACVIGSISCSYVKHHLAFRTISLVYLESKLDAALRVEQCCNFLASTQPSPKCVLYSSHSAYLSNSTTIEVSLWFP